MGIGYTHDLSGTAGKKKIGHWADCGKKKRSSSFLLTALKIFGPFNIFRRAGALWTLVTDRFTAADNEELIICPRKQSLTTPQTPGTTHRTI
jgi:hypothetical protein